MNARVGDVRGVDENGQKRYSLEDVYPHADIVTYFSTYEGFGNALLEAFYFRKPVIMNRYSIFIADIEPRGFDVIAVDGLLTDTVVERVRKVIEDTQYRTAMVERNYELSTAFFSYTVLRRKLRSLVCNVTGTDEL